MTAQPDDWPFMAVIGGQSQAARLACFWRMREKGKGGNHSNECWADSYILLTHAAAATAGGSGGGGDSARRECQRDTETDRGSLRRWRRWWWW